MTHTHIDIYNIVNASRQKKAERVLCYYSTVIVNRGEKRGGVNKEERGHRAEGKREEGTRGEIDRERIPLPLALSLPCASEASVATTSIVTGLRRREERGKTTW